MAAAILAKTSKEEPMESDSFGLEAAAEDLMSAIDSKSAKGVADALRAAFEIARSEPETDMEEEG